MVRLRSAAKKIFRETMVYTPLWMRQYLTNKRIHDLTSHLMTYADIIECQKSEKVRNRIVSDYKKRYPMQRKKLERLMDAQIKNCDIFRTSDPEFIKSIKSQMEYVWFSYGFYPDEFILFDLGGTHIDLRKLQSFVSDTERWAFRYAANDFTFSLLSDKAKTYQTFKKYYKRDIIIIRNARDFRKFIRFTNKHHDFVQKDVSSSRGNGVVFVKDVEDKKKYFKNLLKKEKTLLEERIQQNDIMAIFHKASVNTLRISTYYTHNGIHIGHGIIRVGKDESQIDNAAKGGISATVDVRTGVVCSDGFTTNGCRYINHPNTGVPFKGFHLPEWDEALNICKEISLKLPAMKYLSFDLAYSTRGWMVVEINSSGGYHFQAGAMEGFKSELRTIINSMDLIVPFKLKE